jgi:hypothetical protein
VAAIEREVGQNDQVEQRRIAGAGDLGQVCRRFLARAGGERALDGIERVFQRAASTDSAPSTAAANAASPRIRDNR